MKEFHREQSEGASQGAEQKYFTGSRVKVFHREQSESASQGEE